MNYIFVITYVKKFRGHERSIFQTFWKQEGCTDFLFLELETKCKCIIYS